MLQNGHYVSIRKTEVVNVDESSHRLPPDLGGLAEFKVADYHCPAEWSKDGIFVKVEEGQPLWFDFRANEECAVLCSVQRLNPVTGEPANLEGGLSKDPKQNYLKLPEQMWLDGYAKDGKVYQFVVTKAGEGLAVSEFVLPKHMQDSHALGFAFFPPKNPKPKPAVTRYVPSMPVKYGVVDDYLKSSDTIGSPVFGSSKKYAKVTKGSVARGMLDGGSSVDWDNASEVLCSSAVPATFSAEAPAETCYNIGACAAAEPQEDVVDVLREEVSQKYDKASMGMGGRITQDVVSDSNTVEYYTEKPVAVLTVYFALPEQFDAIMKKSKRQDSTKPDKFIFSGEVGGVQVPLIKPKETTQQAS